MSVTLIAYPLNSSNVEVPYVLDTSAEIDVALTFSAEDYSDLTKRRGAFSKTIVLPNTANNAKCFEFAFNVQSFVGGFQATKKIRAALWSDGVQVFSGVMRLLSMSKIASVVTYEVALFAEDVGLFKSIEGKLLSATAGVSGMNHNVSSGHVSATWSNGSVSGYVYGALDNFGYTDAIQQGSFQVGWWQMLPSIYVKKMIDLIFEEAGYTYTSTFFNTAPFANLVIPYANETAPIVLSGSNAFVAKNSNQAVSQNVWSTVLFQVDNVAPYYDNPNYWNTTTSVFKAGALPAIYNLYIRFSCTGCSGGGAVWNTRIYDAATGTALSVKGVNSLFNGTQTTVVHAAVQLQANQSVRVEMTPNNTGCSIVSGSTLLWEAVRNDAAITLQPFDMRFALPSDVKQSDLLSDLQKMFNLFFQPNPENPKNIRIEPWNSFYTTDVQDWSLLSDEHSEQKFITSDPNAVTNYVFKYRDSDDWLSQQYKASFQLNPENYGGRNYIVDNYYGKGTKVVELLAGTVIPAAFTTDKIAARTWSLDGTALSGTIKARAASYRIAHYKLVTPNTAWQFAQSYTAGSNPTFVVVNQSTLPFIGHMDDPYNPTTDMAFGVPRRLFYSARTNAGAAVPYTNNNLFNAYWLNYITETASKEALTAEVTMILTTAIVAKLNLRNPIYWHGVRWRVLEIRDYLVGQSKPCRDTLRRILNQTAFAGGTFTGGGPQSRGGNNDPNPKTPTGGNGPAEWEFTVQQLSLPAVTGPKGDTGDTGAQGDAGIDGNSTGFVGTWVYVLGGSAGSATEFDSDDDRWNVLTNFVLNNVDAYLIDYYTFMQDLETKFNAGWTIIMTVTQVGKPDNSAIFQTNAWTDNGTFYRIDVDPPSVYDAANLVNGKKYTIGFTLVPPELPAGTNNGDIAIYDGTAWTVLVPPTSGTPTLSWTAASGVHWA